MNCLINGILKYNTYDGTLYLIDGSADMLTLGRVANELLYLMVENNDNPLSRENILNELWTKKGLSSSGNNLNNYMSMLRRTLSNLGIADVIITIPRYGFMFSADVEFVLDENHEADIFFGRIETFISNIIHRDSVYKKIKFIILFIRKRNVSLLAVLVLIVLMFSLLFFRVFKIGNNSFEINNCNVYLLGNPRDKRQTDDDFSVVKKYVIKYKINCGRKADVFYWSEGGGGINENSSDREFLAYCDDSRGGECVNYSLLKREK